MKVRYVAGVSWPRSGHHLMHRLALAYFGGDFRYCLFYTSDPACCGSAPCTRLGMNFTKNHDFDLSVPILPDVPYLIQYRSLTPATISDFELYLLDGGADTKESFQEFARIRAEGWAAFMAKWVDSPVRFERLLVRYEDLVADPHRAFDAAVRFFAPGTKPDQERLARVIEGETHVAVTKQEGEKWTEKAGVRAFRKVEAFRFHDAGFFSELEAFAQEKRRSLAVAPVAEPARGVARRALDGLARSARLVGIGR
ncbi:hypothetical protein DPM33_14255 [Mesorhizobium hawassense]|uniref:Sulfotransferase domain-containing protein n=1 Tax=Mesorhizobium hawassense TaxID=1209954 RepID=A0A330HTT9_9HYPH|nr:hypothetical protein [Mesorhizobium hawassense]RAZ90009.1 hypothetical protein DPM33_14255 [Mesorhizobium hawassense]